MSTGDWNDVYSPANDRYRLRWPRRETVVMLEVAKKPRRGIYLTIEEEMSHGEELRNL